MLRVALLGAPRVERDGVPVTFDTRKATALLAYLAVTGHGHRRDALAALLWPESDQSHARAALRRTLSALGKRLGAGRLVTDRSAIELDRDGLDLDVERFRHLVGEATGVGVLEQAAALHRGDFLEGFGLRDSPPFDDWQFFEAEALRRERAGVLQRLVHTLVEQGGFGRAVPHARQWLALDPLHEPAHRQLISLYAWNDERAAAVRQYRECVRVLDRELGVPPLEETTALYQAVVAGTVQPPPVRQPQPPAPPRNASPGRSARRPLVGRDTELATLVDRHAAIERDGCLVVIEGEPGIGKTRLVEEFLGRTRAAGATALVARCYEGEGQLAYGLVAEALRAALTAAPPGWRDAVPARLLAEAARLAPDLVGDVPTAPPLDSPAAQARLFEGVAAVLLAACAGPMAGAIVLEDLHCADEASLDLLAWLVRRLERRPVCLVATWRSSEVSSHHRLRRLVAEAERAGTATTLRPRPLTASEVAALLDGLGGLGLPDSAALARRLHAETDGVPFFLLAYLDEIVGGRLPAAGEWPVPGGVRDLVRVRLGALSESGRQACATAAVIGGTFDFDLLRAASGRSEDEALAGLEELLANGLVSEQVPAAAYEFAHERVRALVYAEVSLARRRLLHRRIGDALADRAGRPAAVIAHHYRLAGHDVAAAEYFQDAGERARSLYANTEALAHFGAALALGHPRPAALHEAIGDLRTLAGDYAAALASYETAAALGAHNQAGVEQKLGQVHHRRGDWELAEHHFRAALDTAKDPAQRARVQADRSLTAHRRGDSDYAHALASKALELAEAASDVPALAQAHNLLGILAKGQGQHERARAQLERSLALASELDDPSVKIATLNNLALAWAADDELDRALELVWAGLELCAAQGDRHREAALHNNLADLLHAAGRAEEAMAHLKQAVQIFAEVGGPGVMEPEIWKLTEW